MTEFELGKKEGETDAKAHCLGSDWMKRIIEVTLASCRSAAANGDKFSAGYVEGFASINPDQ